MTCLTCKWRRAMGPELPEANATLYKCVRFPRHEVYELTRLDTHGCGEYAVIEPETILRLLFARAS